MRPGLPPLHRRGRLCAQAYRHYTGVGGQTRAPCVRCPSYGLNTFQQWYYLTRFSVILKSCNPPQFSVAPARSATG